MTDDRWAPDDPRADENLWDLVAAIPVPAAADDFMVRLSARLSAGPNDAAALCESRLAVLQGPPARTRRRHPARLFIAAAIVAAAAAVLAFAVLPALRGTDTATAADMLASMSRASSNVQAIRLRVVEHKTIADLILSTNGDFRASQATRPGIPDTWPGDTLARPGQYGYDASRHELRIDSRTSSDGVQVLRPSWPTAVPGPAELSYLTYEDVANSVRALLAEGDPETPVTETTYLGRPAWTASLRDYDWPDVERRVTVDRGTGLLLAIDVVDKRPGGDQSVPFLHVTRLEVDPELPAGWEVVPLLKKAGAFMRWNYFEDAGTRFGSPESVARLASPTPPLIPQWVPPGYRRCAVAAVVFEDPNSGQGQRFKHVLTIPPQGSTPGTSVSKVVGLKRCKKQVIVQFRRGFDTFTIAISPRLPGEGLVDGAHRRGAERAGRDPDGRLPEGGDGSDLALVRGLPLPVEGPQHHIGGHAGTDAAGL